MAGPALPPAKIAEILRTYEETGSIRKTASRTHTDFRTVQRYLNGAKSPASGKEANADGVFVEREDGTAVASADSDTPVRTLDDAVKAAGVDLSTWHVEKWECTQWTVGMKLGTKGSEEVVRSQQYRVKLHLRRIVTRAIGDALQLVIDRLKGRPMKWPKLPGPAKGGGEAFLAVLCLFDVHFGKLAWAKETGEHYDLKIAERCLANAVADLLSECNGRKVAEILLPMGNDWLHIDNRSNTTTRGTSQDVDGRFSKVFAAAIQAAVNAVEAMAVAAPVRVAFVPGNHDRTLAECLCHVLAARFHGTDRVTVDAGPSTRKYVRWGANLIGLAHGDLVRPESLPALMPAEAKRDWAETSCHEWLTGHGHRSKKWTTLDTDTQTGTVVRMLRALTRTDLWHFDSGYVGATPGAEVYFYGKDRGYAGHAVVPARTR